MITGRKVSSWYKKQIQLLRVIISWEVREKEKDNSKRDRTCWKEYLRNQGMTSSEIQNSLVKFDLVAGSSASLHFGMILPTMPGAHLGISHQRLCSWLLSLLPAEGSWHCPGGKMKNRIFSADHFSWSSQGKDRCPSGASKRRSDGDYTLIWCILKPEPHRLPLSQRRMQEKQGETEPCHLPSDPNKGTILHLQSDKGNYLR